MLKLKHENKETNSQRIYYGQPALARAEGQNHPAKHEKCGEAYYRAY